MSPSAFQTSDKIMGGSSLDSTMNYVTSTEQAAMPSGSPIPRPQLVTGSSSSSSSSTRTSSSSSSSTDLTTSVSTPTSTSSNFSLPSTSTPAPAAATSTKSLHPKYNCYKPQRCPKSGRAIEPLSRHYPKPEEEIDIEEALARGPLLGRYRVMKGVTEDEEVRREEFEKVKRELRGWRGV
ncbi:hypothetical protein IFR05_004302 [Cadophora sp. M221]|nr:hypothetical protein IFR05_004302 [Cadophora sp. M221]